MRRRGPGLPASGKPQGRRHLGSARGTPQSQPGFRGGKRQEGAWPTGRFGPQEALSWPAPAHVSLWHGFCGLREAVRNPGSELASVIPLLAACLPLRVEGTLSQRLRLPAHILSTALQDWHGRPCALKPVARRHACPGHPHNGPVHPCGAFASRPDRGSGPPVVGPSLLGPRLSPWPPSELLTLYLLPAPRWSWMGTSPESTSFLTWGMAVTVVALVHLVL